MIPNPKRQSNKTGRFNWYSYYADFSEDFVEAILRSENIGTNHRIADPWNGSGTTTFIAAQFMCDVIGLDLNPVMVIAAKARMLRNKAEIS